MGCKLLFIIITRFSSQRRLGCILDILSLLALSVISALQELSTSRVGKAYHYSTRHADSEGVAVGALAAPWAFAGMLISSLRHKTSSGFSCFAVRSSMVSSFAMVAVLAIRTEMTSPLKYLHDPLAASKDIGSSPLRQRSKAGNDQNLNVNKSRGKMKARGTFVDGKCVALAAGCLVLILILTTFFRGGEKEQLQPAAWDTAYVNGTVAAAGVALNATAAAGSMHLMLTRLPNCFTVGEAMVVAQAIALLLWDVLLLGASFAAGLLDVAVPRSGQWSSHPSSVHQRKGLSSIFASRSEVGLFVELLVFGALLTGLVVGQLLRSLHAPAAQAGKQDKEPKQAVSVAADGSRDALGTEQSKRSGGVRTEGVKRGDWRALRTVGLLVAVLGLALVAAVRPALWALAFALSSWRRVALLGYWALLLAGALPFMDWVSSRVPTIIVRKGYHILAMALFTPALLLEPQLLSISLAIAAALLVVVEVLRVGNVPILGPKIHRFMTSFIDSRDAGALLVSHFSLLAGMAAPVWLSAVSSTPSSGCVPDLATAFSGIMILGVADSAASAIGRRFGRHRILGTRKTVEGTLGGIVCTLAAWLLLWPLCRCGGKESPILLKGILGAVEGKAGLVGGRALVGGLGSGLTQVSGGVALWAMMAATVASCLLEAATTQLDNIFLPLHHYAMVSA
ncbi:probable dolichol kinase at C-terminar half [Coccomyxa sp. Obi]|nr:probable dolichol kinase at C-terminar half [Coccomyxa sp. Obi]